MRVRCPGCQAELDLGSQPAAVCSQCGQMVTAGTVDPMAPAAYSDPSTYPAAGYAPPGYVPPPDPQAAPYEPAAAWSGAPAFAAEEPHGRKYGRRQKSSAAMTVFYGVLGLVVLGAVIVVALNRRPPTIPVENLQAGADDAPANGSGQVVWTDVSKAAMIRTVKVRIPRVDLGPIRARDASNQVVVSQEKDFLTVNLRIQNLNTQPVDYKSWYGNAFTDRKLTAVLADDRGKIYSMLAFTDVRGVQGHTAEATLQENDEIRDALIFEKVSLDGVREFRLELPAAAIGGRGFFRFRFPVDFVDSADDGLQFNPGGPRPPAGTASSDEAESS